MTSNGSAKVTGLLSKLSIASTGGTHQPPSLPAFKSRRQRYAIVPTPRALPAPLVEPPAPPQPRSPYHWTTVVPPTDACGGVSVLGHLAIICLAVLASTIAINAVIGEGNVAHHEHGAMERIK